MQITIDPEFKAMIPQQKPEERAALEASLLRDGCRDALVIWGNILVDGHNRDEICTANGIPYRTVGMDFESRAAATEWIINNQFGRRNLSLYDRTKLALQLEAIYSARAKENQGTRTDIKQNSAVSNQPMETRKEVAKVAGVSHDTVSRVKVIEARASESDKAALSRGERSINEVYTRIKAADDRQRDLEYPPMSEEQWCAAAVSCNEWARKNGRPFSTDEELAAEHGLSLEMVLASTATP